MPKNKSMLYISVIFHIFILGLFYLIIDKLDILYFLALMIIPIIISLILIGITTFSNKEKFNIILTSLVFTLVNSIYFIVIQIILNLSNKINDIYEISKKYNSDMVEVSINNSPIMSLFIIIILSFLLHYMVTKFLFNKKFRTQEENFIND